MHRSLTTIVALGAFALVAACGSDEPATPLTISGGETGTEMWYDPDDPEVEPGRYEITFENVGDVYHELAVVAPSGEMLVARSIAGSESVTFEVDLSESGTYLLACREPGHTEAGMAGTLTVA